MTPPTTIKRPRLYWVLWMPYAGFLRVMVPIFRMVTGRPMQRYSALTPHLWVGGQHYRHGWKAMQARGISAIVSLRTSPNDADLGIAPACYLWLPTLDHTPPSLEDIERGVAFIRGEVERGGTVYVHCRAGVGRAPTLVACYLVSTGLTPIQAWMTIRRVRPFIFPTSLQAQQVVQYYRYIGDNRPEFVGVPS